MIDKELLELAANAAARIEQLEAENEQLSLYKNLADECGLVVFVDLAELQKQRDELLAALEHFINEVPMTSSQYELCRQAIASVKESK